jgi:tetratricopeptide (TPR) repeat protein
MNVNLRKESRIKAGITGFVLFVLLSGMGMAENPIDRLMAEADDLYQKREDLSRAYMALEKYRIILKHESGHYEALWKFSRTAFFIAEMLDSKAEKWKVVEPAIEYAKMAIKVNPNRADGYFWLGVLYTKVGEVKGIFKSLFLIAPIKRAMRRVLKMDETYWGGGAYTVLGKVYSSIPGLLGGSEKKARAFYEKTRKICPSNSLNLLFLAETYHNLGHDRLALKTLETLLAMEADIRWQAEAIKHKAEARKLFELYTGGDD